MFIIFSFNFPIRFNPRYLIILTAVISEKKILSNIFNIFTFFLVFFLPAKVSKFFFIPSPASPHALEKPEGYTLFSYTQLT